MNEEAYCKVGNYGEVVDHGEDMGMMLNSMVR